MPLGEKFLADLRRLVGHENVLTAPEDLIAYSFDGTAALRQMPDNRYRWLHRAAYMHEKLTSS